MKLHAQSRKLLRYALAALSVFAVIAMACPRQAKAQTLTMDFTINSDINSPTESANIAINSTYTVDVWLVALPGANSPPSAPVSDLGIVSAYFGARSSGTGAIAGTGNGISAYSFATGFSGNGPIAPADANGDGINDISSLSNKNTTQNAITSSASNDFANTAGDGGEADGAGWAWEVGTLTVKTGATIGAAGTSTIFTPAIPTFTGARVDWTFNGGTSQVSNATTPTAYPLTAGNAVTFSVAGGGSTALTLAPSALTFNVLQNATASASQNLSLTETSGTGTASYTGTVPAGFTIGAGTASGSNQGNSVGNGASGTVGASGVLTMPTTYTGTTTTDGTTNGAGSYAVASTTGTVTGTPSTFNVVVGNATDDTSATGTFTGSVLSATVANLGLYNGLASSSNSGVKAANPSSTLPGIEGSTATILLGTNNQGSAMTPSMTWRSRMAVETPANDSVGGTGFVNGTPMSPPLPNGRHPIGLISDVVDLFGMSSTSAGPTGSTTGTVAPVQVDPFAFEMNFNPATMIAEGSSGNAMASHGNLYLASLVPVSGVANWENTIVANFEPAGSSATAKFGQVGGTQSNIDIGISAAAAMNAGNALDASSGTFDYPILEPFATWASANGVTAANIGNYVGVWGVDTSSSAGGDEAWAVVDHNSEFAVVPEPSTLILAGFGLFGACLVVSKRRRNIAAA